MCVGRRNIDRAVSILSSLYLLYMEKTYCDPLTKVYEEKGIVTLEKEPWLLRAFTGEMMIRPFPRHLVTSEDQLWVSVLGGNSKTVVGLFKPMLDEFLLRKSI